jgi:hypothetical protein
MARRSKKGNMKALSTILFLTAGSLITASVTNIYHRDFLTGIQLIGWALVALALLLAFTFPVKCKVKTARSKACGNNAYGFLFGCSQAAGHWFGKFRARLGLQGDMVKPVGRSLPKASDTAMYQVTGESQPVRVKIEDSTLSICASWATVISAITGIAAITISLASH